MQRFTIEQLSRFVDTLGAMKAAAADLDRQMKDIQETLKASGLKEINGAIFRATISVTERVSLDAEAVKALLAEEVAGRARSMLASRRKAAGFPTGKIFAAWDPDACSIPTPTFATHTNSTALSRDEIFRDRCPYAQESPGIRSASRSRPCPHRLTRSPSSMGRP